MISLFKRLFGRAGNVPKEAKSANSTISGTGQNAKAMSRTGVSISSQEKLQKAYDFSNAITINFSEDLPPFTKKLSDDLEMLPSTRKLVCPIEVVSASRNGKAKFALIAIKSANTLEVAKEVEKQLEYRGYTRAENFLYLAPQNVMLELARDSIISNVKTNQIQLGQVSGRENESILSETFMNAISFAIKNEASDLHIEVNDKNERSQIRFRVDGMMTDPKEFQLSTKLLADVLAYAYNINAKSGSENMYNANIPQQCQMRIEVNKRKILLRWASTQNAVGTKAVLRLLYQDESTSIRSLLDLGYLPMQVDIWNRAIRRLGGGILLSGVVGSGKSTTMQTVMDMLPSWMSKYTVEDPVEYIMPGVCQISVSRNLSEREKDPFLAIKRQLKRLDPDAVLIGEIRDHESGAMFRDIAESGHRAFATIHTPSAIDTITMRLTSEEIGIPKDVIATPGFINLLVYQALVPKLCSCAVDASTVYTTEYLQLIKQLFDIDAEKIRAKNHEGCDCCRRSSLPELNGTRGRTVVAEMVELDGPMRDYFIEGQNARLKDYIRMQNKSRYDEPVSTGKSAMEVAMYHVANGVIDPVDVEMKFGSFLQYEAERKA